MSNPTKKEDGNDMSGTAGESWTERAEREAAEAREQVMDGLDAAGLGEWSDTARRAEARLQRLVDDYPLVSLLAAVAAGYVLARALRR